LHVSAKDKKTGKEQRIEIKAGSGLSEDEIQQMVKDAEIHKDEDKKFHELIGARNQADALLHETRRAIKESGDKVDGAQIAKAEAAISELEVAMKGDSKGAIEAKTQALAEASQNLRAAASSGGAAGGDAGPGASASSGQAGAPADDVVDAEFTEVDDSKR